MTTLKIERLKTALPLLPEKDKEFARSLIQQCESRRTLSPKQWDWVDKLADRAAQPFKPRQTVGDLSGVLALFDRAAKRLKFPAIVLQVDETLVRLYVAGERSKTPGAVNVTDTGSFESRQWYGRIHRDGSFETSRATAPAALLSRLQDLAADPVKVATEHGRLTGRCCFCNIALKDERSTAVGYGKTCATNYGLAWGARPVEFAAQAA